VTLEEPGLPRWKRLAVWTVVVAFLPLVLVAWGWQYHQAHPKFNPATYCDDIFAGKHVQPPQGLAIDCAIPPDPRF
jgi:hypothetical protein